MNVRKSCVNRFRVRTYERRTVLCRATPSGYSVRKHQLRRTRVVPDARSQSGADLPQALGLAYEHPERVSDDTIETYLRPHLRSAQRLQDLERFVNAFDCRHTVDIEAALKLVHAPTLIAWGTDDIFFDLKWSYWLENTIAGSRRRMEITGGRIFFPEARASEFNEAVRTHWLSISEPPTR